MTETPQYLTVAQKKAVDLAEISFKAVVKAQAALKSVEELQAAFDLAQAEFQWAKSHPALPAAWVPTEGKADSLAEEEKPKRTRRTKAQIEADKAAESAETEAAAPLEAEALPEAPPAHEPDVEEERIAEEAPAQTVAPTPPPAADNPFNPFG